MTVPEPVAPDPPAPDSPAPDPETWALAEALAEVGRRVRDAVRGSAAGVTDRSVVRFEGGDDVYGIDVRAEEVLLDGLAKLGSRWPGSAVVEGHAEPIVIGDADERGAALGPWCYLVDPVDGTRPYLAGKRSAWVLLGAGREATTLEDLEVGAMVEVPTDRARVGLVSWAVRGAGAQAVDDDLIDAGAALHVELAPRADDDVQRSFVTVVHLLPGSHGPTGEWADRHLAGLEVWDDLSPCTGGAVAGLMTGADVAVLDPRPLLHAEGFSAHPYDLAGLVVAREAGVVVEALPPGPLAIALDTDTPVAWAGYANEAVARRLRPTDLA